MPAFVWTVSLCCVKYNSGSQKSVQPTWLWITIGLNEEQMKEKTIKADSKTCRVCFKWLTLKPTYPCTSHAETVMSLAHMKTTSFQSVDELVFPSLCFCLRCLTDIDLYIEWEDLNRVSKQCFHLRRIQ